MNDINCKDLSKTLLKLKITGIYKTARPDGFNGYGKQRPNHNVFYGTYAEYVKQAGIYWIKNTITNRIYIGSSKDIGSRLIKHFSQLRKGNHPNWKLKDDFNKYGQDSFEFGVFEYVSENLSDKERDYQVKFPFDSLYNLQVKGVYRSDAQIESAKLTPKDKYKTEEYRRKMSKLKSNRIGRFDKFTYKLLETFENSTEACEKYNLAKSTLLGCCNGSKRSAKGYVWHYLDKDNNILVQGKGVNRDIKHNEDIVLSMPKGIGIH